MNYIPFVHQNFIGYNKSLEYKINTNFRIFRLIIKKKLFWSADNYILTFLSPSELLNAGIVLIK